MADKNNKPNSFVIDPVKGYGPEYIENPQGMRWEYNGNWLYLYKRIDDKLEPYEPEADMSVPPDELYRVLRIPWPLVRKVFGRDSKTLERVKTGLMIGIMGALLFFIYLIYHSATGGA